MPKVFHTKSSQISLEELQKIKSIFILNLLIKSILLATVHFVKKSLLFNLKLYNCVGIFLSRTNVFMKPWDHMNNIIGFILYIQSDISFLMVWNHKSNEK